MAYEFANAAYQKYSSWKEFANSFICGGTYNSYKQRGFANGKFDEKTTYEFFDSLCGIVKELFSDKSGEYWNKEF